MKPGTKGEEKVLCVVERFGSKYAIVSMDNGSYNLYNVEIDENGMLQHIGESKGILEGKDPNRVLKVLAELLAKNGVSEVDTDIEDLKKRIEEQKKKLDGIEASIKELQNPKIPSSLKLGALHISRKLKVDREIKDLTTELEQLTKSSK